VPLQHRRLSEPLVRVYPVQQPGPPTVSYVPVSSNTVPVGYVASSPGYQSYMLPDHRAMYPLEQPPPPQPQQPPQQLASMSAVPRDWIAVPQSTHGYPLQQSPGQVHIQSQSWAPQAHIPMHQPNVYVLGSMPYAVPAGQPYPVPQHQPQLHHHHPQQSNYYPQQAGSYGTSSIGVPMFIADFGQALQRPDMDDRFFESEYSASFQQRQQMHINMQQQAGFWHASPGSYQRVMAVPVAPRTVLSSSYDDSTGRMMHASYAQHLQQTVRYPAVREEPLVAQPPSAAVLDTENVASREILVDGSMKRTESDNSFANTSVNSNEGSTEDVDNDDMIFQPDDLS